MKAYIFPGQGAQFEGMGQKLVEASPESEKWLQRANDILGWDIASVMVSGTMEELKQTKVTQPAIFIHSVVTEAIAPSADKPEGVAGHSLGEFTALVVSGALSFEEGLKLVSQRAMAMQACCEESPGTMAAVLGLDDEVIEEVCSGIDGVVVAANYNCPGQLVISGDVAAVKEAAAILEEKGARRVVMLPVGGAFHSPLMKAAEEKLAQAIKEADFKTPICPVYQNVDAQPYTDPETIRENLIKQLTSPVRWTQTMQNMLANGFDEFVEVGGTGSVLRGMLRKIDRKVSSSSL